MKVIHFLHGYSLNIQEMYQAIPLMVDIIYICEEQEIVLRG
nr:unnamed protein product [Callosobruchus chinensis]